jgi:hypothetical protein
VSVDTGDAPMDLIQPGFVAAMNYGDEDAEKAILCYSDVIGKVSFSV